MLQVIITLDYEIHGNGDGNPMKMMVRPTYRLMDFLESYGAKLTIFADVAEILKFKKYKETFGEDKYHIDAIENQLIDSIKRGHDVQLHIHSSYFNAKYENEKWVQDWTEFNLANLAYDRINHLIKICKNYLEDLLKPIDSTYNCYAFRAAGWSMSPSKNIVNALVNNSIYIDSSVWKNGKYGGNINFDYTNAQHNLIPWFASEDDICKMNKNSKLLEVPIYCEDRNIWAFITPNRIYRTVRSKFHKHTIHSKDKINKKIETHQNPNPYLQKVSNLLTGKMPWKLDINYPMGYQLISVVKKLARKYNPHYKILPIVVSGHSKSFTIINQLFIKSFLRHVSKKKNDYCYALYKDIIIDDYKDIDYNKAL